MYSWRRASTPTSAMRRSPSAASVSFSNVNALSLYCALKRCELLGLRKNPLYSEA